MRLFSPVLATQMFKLLHRVTTESRHATRLVASVTTGLLAVTVVMVLALAAIEIESAALAAHGLSEEADLLLSFLQ